MASGGTDRLGRGAGERGADDPQAVAPCALIYVKTGHLTGS